MFYLFEKVKEEVRWSLVVAWPSLGLWGLSSCMVLGFTCVEFQLIACGWNSTVISHASYIVKTPTTIYIYVCVCVCVCVYLIT